MNSKFGFTQYTIQEFEAWITNLKIARTVLTIQHHHTFIPNYSHFKGNNHFEMQKSMESHHINHNGWDFIGQHFSVFPDGTILTGRSLEKSPACIYGQNANAICIESVGNFDVNKDVMTAAQKDSIVRITAKLCSRMNVKVNTNTIVYHHWFNLATGERNDGSKNNKSCPGTGFFGGNKVSDCTAHFLPLVNNALNGITGAPVPGVIQNYVTVNTDRLNIRKKPDAKSEKVDGREPALMGAILRVYKEDKGWLKISASAENWVLGKYTSPVIRSTVNANTLNVRSGPDISYSKIGSYQKGQELFIAREENGWCKINLDEKWVKKEFLDFK